VRVILSSACCRGLHRDINDTHLVCLQGNADLLLVRQPRYGERSEKMML
jgi:hypothetical protein